MKSRLKIAFCKQTINSSLRIAAFVGTLLFFINYGDRLLGCGLKLDELIVGNINRQNLLLEIGLGKKESIKIFLSYLVPYCVSTYSHVKSFKHYKNMS